MSGPEDLIHGPLHSRHTEAGATFAPFGGWTMPVQYESTVAEHTATRASVGLFDVSHLGKVTVTGPDAVEFVNTCLTNDLGKVADGHAQYTLCCDDSTGGTIDDMILYRVSDDEVFLIPNAANAEEVLRLLREAAADRAPGISITDEHRSHAVVAVQGPYAGEVVEALGLPTDLDFMAFTDAEFRDGTVRVCRTGYTGEYGFELLPRWEDAGALWDALAAEVRARDGALCGLAARDSLRTEAGFSLHGNELSRELSPLEARSSWAVGWDKPRFWGRDELLRQKEAGPARRLYAVEVTGRGVLRPGLRVLADGHEVGVTSSGTYSPTLGTGVGLAFIDTGAGLRKGDDIVVDVRGREVRCRMHVPPLIEIHTK